MNSPAKHSPITLVLAIACFAGIPALNGAEPTSTTESNKQIIQASFDRWRTGTGGPFELLAAEADWTITGHSIVARKYESRDAFMESVIRPFNARLSKPLVPAIRILYGEGDTVIALFDAEAMAHDGRPYRNTYAWFMKMRDGRIVSVTAFFDSLAFDDFWKRVEPRQKR